MACRQAFVFSEDPSGDSFLSKIPVCIELAYLDPVDYPTVQAEIYTLSLSGMRRIFLCNLRLP